VTKPGYTILSRRQKGSQCSGIILNRTKRRNSRQLLLQEKSWLLSFGIVKESF
jgi:hypothetical protein